VRDEVVDYVAKWSGRSELPATRLVKWIGVGMSKFYDWRARYGKVGSLCGAAFQRTADDFMTVGTESNGNYSL